MRNVKLQHSLRHKSICVNASSTRKQAIYMHVLCVIIAMELLLPMLLLCTPLLMILFVKDGA